MNVYTTTLESGLTLIIFTEITFGQAIIASVLMLAISILLFKQIHKTVWN